jgi:hypothetical protein
MKRRKQKEIFKAHYPRSNALHHCSFENTNKLSVHDVFTSSLDTIIDVESESLTTYFKQLEVKRGRKSDVLFVLLDCLKSLKKDAETWKTDRFDFIPENRPSTENQTFRVRVSKLTEIKRSLDQWSGEVYPDTAISKSRSALPTSLLSSYTEILLQMESDCDTLIDFLNSIEPELKNSVQLQEKLYQLSKNVSQSSFSYLNSSSDSGEEFLD